MPDLTTLPGVECEQDGTITFTLTDQERQAIDGMFDIAEEERLAVRTDYAERIQKTLMAGALANYAKQEVIQVEMCEPSERLAALRKALAAIIKATTIHDLPIYAFDLGCIFELLGHDDVAADCFREFLQYFAQFTPTDLDAITLKTRNTGLATKIARTKLEYLCPDVQESTHPKP